MRFALIVIALLLHSKFAFALLIGGVACPGSEGFKLHGYWKDYDQVWSKLHALSEDEIIERIESSYGLKDFNHFSFRDQIANVKSQIETVNDLTFRLSEEELISCEGVFYIHGSKGWISKPVFDQLLPFERVTIYIEYINAVNNLENVRSRSFRSLSAGFHLTHKALVTDPNLWLSNYNEYTGESDVIQIFEKYYFTSTRFEIKEDVIVGVFSPDSNAHYVNGHLLSLNSAQVIISNKKITEVIPSTPVVLTLEAGKFLSSHFTLDDDQNVKCALFSGITFLSNENDEIKVFLPGTGGCFKKNLIHRISTDEDFQLSK